MRERLSKRYGRWRYRLRSTVHLVGEHPVRLTYQRGRLVCVEFWGGPPLYTHTYVRGSIDPRGQISNGD